LRQFTLSLAAPGPTEATLMLSYIITGASWFSRYDVRVDTSNDDCVLAYFGVITNSTGEDWKDVKIALSTAAPSLGGEPPKLYPLKIDYTENAPARAISPPVAERLVRRTSIAASIASPREREEKKKEEVFDLSSKVQSQGTSSTFHIERKSTIESDKKPHKVTVTKTSVATTREYVVVPAKSENAYLKATARNDSGYQLLDGDLNVFMDGLFITTSRLKRTSPGEEFQLYLGVDGGVRVDIKPQSKVSETSGIMKKFTTMTHKFSTVIKNNKKHPIKVLVFDQIPFSSDKSIKVKIEQPADQTEYILTEESIMKRTFKLGPGTSQTTKLCYTVETSSDTSIYYVPQLGGEINY